jgi:ribose/xylose/arabinose/galactoside ABC-type transport system permease subunit
MKGRLSSIEWNRYGLIIAFVLWCGALAIFEPVFLTTTNLLNVLRQISMVSIIAIGSFLAILTGGIDLSVGSVTALSGVMAAVLMKTLGLPVGVGILGGILVGAVIGVLNGFMITRIRMAAFIATLITLNLAKGLAFIITDGTPVSGMPEAFVWIGRGYVGFIPFPIIVMVVIFIVAAFVLRSTRFGLRIYGIGGNAEAVRLAGVSVRRHLWIVYSVSGVMAGIAGVILASRLSSGTPNVGESYVFEAITAVVLGGVSLSGGSGGLLGVFLGSVFMGTISNGLNLMNVPSYFQMVAKALLLAAAVTIDTRARHARR